MSHSGTLVCRGIVSHSGTQRRNILVRREVLSHSGTLLCREVLSNFDTLLYREVMSHSGSLVPRPSHYTHLLYVRPLNPDVKGFKGRAYTYSGEGLGTRLPLACYIIYTEVVSHSGTLLCRDVMGHSGIL